MERKNTINARAMGIVQNHYSQCYNTEKEDSPNSSRDSLRRKLRLMSEYLKPDDLVLDLGAGRQIFERGYRQAYGEPNFRFVSADFAKIGKKKLLSSNDDSHTRSSGCNLPFRDEVFSVVVSSMALDFMPQPAISEVVRVMKPEARALVTLHHKDLVNQKLEAVGNKRRPSKSAQNIKHFFEYLRDNEVLFDGENEIRETFEYSGFMVINLRLANDRWDKWWEVDLLKKPIMVVEAEDALVARQKANHRAYIDWINV